MKFGLENPINAQDSGSAVQFNGENFVAGLNTPNMNSLSNAGSVFAASATFGRNYTAVCYGNGLYVALAYDGVTLGRVMTSPDGVTWTQQSAPVITTWYGICYGRGLFVAVGYSGSTTNVMTSPDGINWTLRTAGNNGAYYTSVVFARGLFVATASGDAHVLTSSDGITWTPHAVPQANAWWSITFGNGLFVAVAYALGTHRVMTSPDGVNWTAQLAAELNQWYSVCFGNGLFVAVAASGTNRIMTSVDGASWTARAAVEADTWVGVTYGNGLFMAVAQDGSTRIMTSPDGITWTKHIAPAAKPWMAVCYGAGKFVGVSYGGSTPEAFVSGGELTTILPSGLADGSQTLVVPTAGQSLVIPNRVMTYVVEPAADIATLTLAMPTAPYHGQIVILCAGSFGVTALTLNASAGQAFATGAAITSMLASARASYQYNQSTAKWYRIG